jgi:hypothetical protein
VVVVDGACPPLALASTTLASRGTAGKGAYEATLPLADGCHPYYFLATAGGMDVTYPDSGALEVGVGSAATACALFVPTRAAATCGGGGAGAGGGGGVDAGSSSTTGAGGTGGDGGGAGGLSTTRAAPAPAARRRLGLGHAPADAPAIAGFNGGPGPGFRGLVGAAVVQAPRCPSGQRSRTGQADSSAPGLFQDDGLGGGRPDGPQRVGP